MSEIKVAIVEDEKQYRDTLIRYLQKIGEETGNVFSWKCFISGYDFLENHEGYYDLIFLDIGMAGRNGRQLAKEIRKVDDKCKLVFITALQQYAIEGYSVQASDYRIKPVQYSEFKLKRTRLFLQRNAEREKNTVLIKTEAGLIRVNQNEIIYCETLIHKIILHTMMGDYETYSSRKDFEKKLTEEYLVRCNSCYIVNLNKVDKIEKSIAYLSNGVKLSISRPRLKETIAKFKELGK